MSEAPMIKTLREYKERYIDSLETTGVVKDRPVLSEQIAQADDLLDEFIEFVDEQSQKKRKELGL